MKSDVQENMEALSRAIMAEANAESEKILSDARAKADAIRQTAQDQAAAAKKEILDKAKQESNQMRSQAIATTQLKARTMQLDAREKLLNKVFATAQQDLASVQQWTDYGEIAQNLLREALMQMRAKEVEIHADPRTQSFYTQAFLGDLSQKMNVQIKLGKPLDKGIGVVVESDNGHLQFDNTLETRLKRMQNELRAPVYHILMSEAAL